MRRRGAAWPRASLGDHVDLVAGFPFKSGKFLDSADGAVPLVKGENVSQGRILWSISKYWPAEEYAEYERYHLRRGDVVVAMDRPWVPAGLKWACIRHGDSAALLVQRCARLRTKSPEALSQRFLRFVIGGPGFEDYVRPITTGVNVPHISGAQILAYTFPLPPIAAQEQIADVLQAYDDLLENCERRIRILDEMMRAVYREWFVLFRFPGHGRAKLVESVIGKVPADWTVAPLSSVAKVNAQSVNVRNPPSRIRYIDISSVSPGVVEKVVEYDFAEAPGRARRIVRHGDVVWSCVRPNRRSYALLLHPAEGTIASTGFAVLRAKRCRTPISTQLLPPTTLWRISRSAQRAPRTPRSRVRCLRTPRCWSLPRRSLIGSPLSSTPQWN